MAKKTTRKFRVLDGAHVGPDRVYRKGEVVETDLDLVKTFGSTKFVEVGGGSSDDEEVEASEKKIVIDGARSGESTASVSRSATTASSGPTAADWAVTERAGKGSEVNQPEEEEEETDEDAEEEERTGTRSVKTAGRRKRRTT